MFSASRDKCRILAWFAGICAVILLAGLAPWSAAQSAPPTTALAQAAAPDDPNAGLLTPGILRIAADPNDLPFSNDKSEGFENKIAELLAKTSTSNSNTSGALPAAASSAKPSKPKKPTSSWASPPPST